MAGVGRRSARRGAPRVRRREGQPRKPTPPWPRTAPASASARLPHRWVPRGGRCPSRLTSPNCARPPSRPRVPVRRAQLRPRVPARGTIWRHIACWFSAVTRVGTPPPPGREAGGLRPQGPTAPVPQGGSQRPSGTREGRPIRPCAGVRATTRASKQAPPWCSAPSRSKAWTRRRCPPQEGRRRERASTTTHSRRPCTRRAASRRGRARRRTACTWAGRCA